MSLVVPVVWVRPYSEVDANLLKRCSYKRSLFLWCKHAKKLLIPQIVIGGYINYSSSVKVPIHEGLKPLEGE